MAELVQQRCFNHGFREAVARCPGCRRYFCRECVTEHGGRVMCAGCLRQADRPSSLARRGLAGVGWVARGLLGLVLSWCFFYLVGDILLSVPSAWHEGSVWRVRWFASP